jgi:hypothetical protein
VLKGLILAAFCGFAAETIGRRFLEEFGNWVWEEWKPARYPTANQTAASGEKRRR